MKPHILKPKVSEVHMMNSHRSWFGLVVKGARFFLQCSDVFPQDIGRLSKKHEHVAGSVPTMLILIILTMILMVMKRMRRRGAAVSSPSSASSSNWIIHLMSIPLVLKVFSGNSVVPRVPKPQRLQPNGATMASRLTTWVSLQMQAFRVPLGRNCLHRQFYRQIQNCSKLI